MDGIRLNDYESLEAFGVDKQKIVEEITRAYAHQIYVDGFFNGDPHPGILSLSIYLSFLFSLSDILPQTVKSWSGNIVSFFDIIP